MKKIMSSVEREFLAEGARTYADVYEATSEYERLVQQQCLDAIKKRLQDLKQAIGIPLRADEFRKYIEHGKKGTARYHCIGKKLPIAGFGLISVYFLIYRDDDDQDPLIHGAYLLLWRARQDLAEPLWIAKQKLEPDEEGDSWTKDYLVFGGYLDRIDKIEAHLDRALLTFIKFMDKHGPLKRYVRQKRVELQ